MSKTYKKEIITSEHNRLIKKECDFCGSNPEKTSEKELKDLFNFTGCGYYTDLHAIIEIRMSQSYFECGNSKKIEIDCCAKCFKEKIMSQVKQYDEVDADW